jgi:glucose/arabinose dehydrogenase
MQVIHPRKVRPLPEYVFVLVSFALIACGTAARLPVTAGMGPQPTLPKPDKSLIPLVKVVTAKGWPAGATPVSAEGTSVGPFAQGLDHPRWVYVLPNGDVLVAETNAPPRPEDGKGIKGGSSKYQKKAGGAVPSANRITLLRDADGDGVAEVHTVFLKDLMAPFGMALVGSTLCIANTDAVVQFPYAPARPRSPPPSGRGPARRTAEPSLDEEPIASPDGSKLYVGSAPTATWPSSIEKEEGRAAIWEIDPATGAHRIFASGLRNPVGMAWHPDTKALWAAVNERDELGSDLVPDYMTSVRDGAFYGWPYSYYGANVDQRVKPAADLVAEAIAPDYALGLHGVARTRLCR